MVDSVKCYRVLAITIWILLKTTISQCTSMCLLCKHFECYSLELKKKSMCSIGIVTDFLVILWTNKTIKDKVWLWAQLKNKYRILIFQDTALQLGEKLMLTIRKCVCIGKIIFSFLFLEMVSWCCERILRWPGNLHL